MRRLPSTYQVPCVLVLLVLATVALCGCGDGGGVLSGPPAGGGGTRTWTFDLNGQPRTFAWTDQDAEWTGGTLSPEHLEIYFDKDRTTNPPLRTIIVVDDPDSVTVGQPTPVRMEIWFTTDAHDYFCTDADHQVSVTFSKFELKDGGKVSGTAEGTLVNDAAQVLTLDSGAFANVVVYDNRYKP